MAKKRASKKQPQAEMAPAAQVPETLLADLRSLIQSTRSGVARAVNSAQVLLYWQVGQRIYAEILRGDRAAYGEEIVATVSRQLAADYGRGFAEKSLRRMIQFAQAFPEREVVAGLSRELSWSHFVELLPVNDDLKRQFYGEMCRIERWSVRTLRAKIDGMLFERTCPESPPSWPSGSWHSCARRTGSRRTWSSATRTSWTSSGSGTPTARRTSRRPSSASSRPSSWSWAPASRSSPASSGSRSTARTTTSTCCSTTGSFRRLVAIELKLGTFQAADKGQMELYLRWLERHEAEPGEEPPLGLILCTGKSDEHVELLQLDKSGIRVASYLTELPPRELLERKLHESARRAKARLEARGLGFGSAD